MRQDYVSFKLPGIVKKQEEIPESAIRLGAARRTDRVGAHYYCTKDGSREED